MLVTGEGYSEDLTFKQTSEEGGVAMGPCGRRAPQTQRAGSAKNLR